MRVMNVEAGGKEFLLLEEEDVYDFARFA